jgi:carbonic anhydrase
VIWIVKRTPVTVSKPQVKALEKVLGYPNNRPIQPVNARLVIE